MSLYAAAISIHIMVAVLGIGVVGAIPFAARLARRNGAGLSTNATLLDTLLRPMRWSLAAMLVTGCLLDYAASGAFHSTAWFRLSVVLFVFLGFSYGRTRAVLRTGLAGDGAGEAALRRVERWGWIMCGTAALMAVLMEVKPFQ